MAVPGSLDARYFRRCAIHRYREAELLNEHSRTTGAVYLAGYGVECMLKALLLGASSVNRRMEVLNSFRGHKAHDFSWLRSQYLTASGARLPPEIARQFTLVNDWSTDLRYLPRTIPPNEAEEFLAAAGAIIQWADGRL